MDSTSVTVIGTHGGIEISIGRDGKFFCRLGEEGTPGGRTISDKTLDGLKTKIDAHARLAARRKGAAIDAVIMQRKDRWNDEGRTTWTHGTFAGLNAHSGDLTFLTGKGEKVEASRYYAWLFPANSPHLEQLKALAAERDRAELAAKRADQALTAALKAHGFQPERLGRGTNAAAELETAIVEFLSTGVKPKDSD
jgi:hypothetical protein